jgi:DNA-directed RNA polymerase subunit RPC12/RpoP
MKHCCTKCGKEVEKLLTTAYGDKRCEACYDDYLMTDRGKVEYLIGLAMGEYPAASFDAEFLGHVWLCWKNYRDELNLTMKEIKNIEGLVEMFGLFKIEEEK